MIGPALGGVASRELRSEQTRVMRLHEPPFAGVCAVTLGALVATTLIMLGAQEISR